MAIVRRELLHVLQDLPPMCALKHPSDGTTILVKRGVVGYWPFDADPDVLNERWGVTPRQREAMRHGSMFGFECPAGDPQNYDDNGNML